MVAEDRPQTYTFSSGSGKPPTALTGLGTLPPYRRRRYDPPVVRGDGWIKILVIIFLTIFINLVNFHLGVRYGRELESRQNNVSTERPLGSSQSSPNP